MATGEFSCGRSPRGRSRGRATGADRGAARISEHRTRDHTMMVRPRSLCRMGGEVVGLRATDVAGAGQGWRTGRRYQAQAGERM